VYFKKKRYRENGPKRRHELTMETGGGGGGGGGGVCFCWGFVVWGCGVGGVFVVFVGLLFGSKGLSISGPQLNQSVSPPSSAPFPHKPTFTKKLPMAHLDHSSFSLASLLSEKQGAELPSERTSSSLKPQRWRPVVIKETKATAAGFVGRAERTVVNPSYLSNARHTPGCSHKGTQLRGNP